MGVVGLGFPMCWRAGSSMPEFIQGLRCQLAMVLPSHRKRRIGLTMQRRRVAILNADSLTMVGHHLVSDTNDERPHVFQALRRYVCAHCLFRKLQLPILCVSIARKHTKVCSPLTGSSSIRSPRSQCTGTCGGAHGLTRASGPRGSSRTRGPPSQPGAGPCCRWGHH